MTRPAAARPGEIRIVLTIEQLRDFTACATTCGVTVESWILQCAQVQAAAAVDAMQAEERSRRLARGRENQRVNARRRANRPESTKERP